MAKMTKYIKCFLVFFILLGVFGCKIDALSAFQNGKNIKLEIHENGQPIFEKQIEPNSEIYVWVADWLGKNESGWSQSPASYLPFCVVKGENLSLNFLNDMAIINIKDQSGKQSQLVKTISPGEYGFLLRQKAI